MGSLSTLAGLMALAVMAWEMGGMTWLIMPTSAGDTPTATIARDGAKQPRQAAQTDRRGPEIDTVIQRHLFGQPTVETNSQPQNVEDAPETRLDLKLQGIYFSSVADHSIAIIKPGDQDRQLYRVGDTVAGQARITAIEREQVVLARGGRREVLPLETETLDSGVEASTTETIDDEQRQRLSDYRERIQKNPQQLRQLMNPSPVRDGDGNLRGYRIEPGQSSDLFDVTDLKPGDVVTAIGDTKLDSDQAAMKAMQELGSSNSVEITVERDGSQRRVMLNFGN